MIGDRRIPVRMLDEATPPRPRKTRLPYKHQWVHHDKPGGRAAQRRLRQMQRNSGGGR